MLILIDIETSNLLYANDKSPVCQNQNGAKTILLIKPELKVASQTCQWFWTSLVSEPTSVYLV